MSTPAPLDRHARLRHHQRAAMLIDCPECARSVSDRAPACPQCGFPIAEHVAEQAKDAAAKAEVASRVEAGRTDCPTCEARGFCMVTFESIDGEEREGFSWCQWCDHGGRITLCKSARGFWAVADARVATFLAGECGEADEGVTFLGEQAPPARYPGSASDSTK